MLTFISDVHALGLPVAQDPVIASEYHWDDEAARGFAKRFEALENRKPIKLQAAPYAGVLHCLKAVAATGTTAARAVNAAMRATPVDLFGQTARVRANRRVTYDLGLYRVKSPWESRFPWDYYAKLQTNPGKEAFRPEEEGGCKLG